jgi:hypothetical protein
MNHCNIEYPKAVAKRFAPQLVGLIENILIGIGKIMRECGGVSFRQVGAGRDHSGWPK